MWEQISEFMKWMIFLSLLISIKSLAQYDSPNDSTLNNLVHPSGYATCDYGSVPEYVKTGRGKKAMVLIPGLGFDASVFGDFMEANKDRYKMLAITIPGFGFTRAPAMPDERISYGEQTWTKSAIVGIARLIEKEKIGKPIIVGHFITGTQLAIGLAIDYPDKVGGVIILGGSGKMMAFLQGKLREAPLGEMIKGVDTYWAPQWFKHMKKSFYDNGNFIPEIYSLNDTIAVKLWQKVADVPMSVAVRYSCEYFASDVIAEADQVKCPMLVLRATFDDNLWKNEMNKNWIQPQFIESWNVALQRNPSIKIVDIQQSATFVWKDKPAEVYKVIREFVK